MIAIPHSNNNSNIANLTIFIFLQDYEAHNARLICKPTRCAAPAFGELTYILI